MPWKEAKAVKMLVGVVVLLCLASVALAQCAAPEVTSPTEDSQIGPSVDVVGKTEGKHFVVILTDVYLKDQDRPLRSVPGHRHWTEEDGKFSLRIATPRVLNVKDSDLTYKIRVFIHDPGQEKGPETVITCTAK